MGGEEPRAALILELAFCRDAATGCVSCAGMEIGGRRLGGSVKNLGFVTCMG